MAQSRLSARARRSLGTLIRRTQREAEVRPWKPFRNEQLSGNGLRRQHRAVGFVVDFCAPHDQLIVELDAIRHDEPEQSVFDEKRTAELEGSGLPGDSLLEQ